MVRINKSTMESSNQSPASSKVKMPTSAAAATASAPTHDSDQIPPLVWDNDSAELPATAATVSSTWSAPTHIPYVLPPLQYTGSERVRDGVRPFDRFQDQNGSAEAGNRGGPVLSTPSGSMAAAERNESESIYTPAHLQQRDQARAALFPGLPFDSGTTSGDPLDYVGFDWRKHDWSANVMSDKKFKKADEEFKNSLDAMHERNRKDAMSAFFARVNDPTPVKAASDPKVQPISSTFPSSNAAERSSSRQEFEGYLPTIRSIERAPLTALKEVRAELQKTFPEVLEGTTPTAGGAEKLESALEMGNKGKGKALEETAGEEQTLFGGFKATQISSESPEVAELKQKLHDLEFKQRVQEVKMKLMSERRQKLKADRDAAQLKAGPVRSWHQAVAQGTLKDFSSKPEPTRQESCLAVNDNTLAQTFSSADFPTESFAELNNRLKTGSRLSAIIGNKADFRARWESLSTALPRYANAQDFVRLVTPGGSPTKPDTPSQSSSLEQSGSSSTPADSLTDYYNKRFESLGAEAKELIMKAQKTFMAPPAPTRSFDPANYTKPFCDFLTENPTIFHAVDYFATKLTKAGFEKLSERDLWTDKLEAGGKYFVERNGTSLIAFSVGKAYKSGNGVAMIAGHIDALTARLKPVSTKRTKAGYVQLGVAPYAGGLNATWWDRDLSIGGRVLVKDEKTGKITSKLVKLGWPIARIPTLAPHFGVGMMGTNNPETEAVPIIGIDNSDLSSISKEEDAKWKASSLLGGEGTFAATQPPKLLKAIAGELNIQNYSSIVNWELELFDTQPAQVGGLEKEFIFAGRIDDKLCSWAALEALLAASESPSEDSGIINLVGLFDDEEIGSLLRQGARGNFLPSVIERITESFSHSQTSSSNLLSQTYANSFLISADVTHAVNPNFLDKYLEGHAPRLNVGVVVSADSNGHMTTDPVSTAVMQQVAEKSGSVLQLFMIRNDSRSGGTVGPMLSSAMGVRAIDMGIPQLSMHSVRATTGSLDPGLGVKLFKGFLEGFEAVDSEFE